MIVFFNSSINYYINYVPAPIFGEESHSNNTYLFNYVLRAYLTNL